MSQMDETALSACRAIRASRADAKGILVVAAISAVAALMWAIRHHQPLLAAALVVVAVLGSNGLADKFGDDQRSFFSMFNLKRRSWGFLAMGTLLPAAAYIETEHWPARWYNSWSWALIAGGAVAAYTVVFCKGEAKNYDYLRFNSYSKLVGNLFAVPVSFVVVAFGLPPVLLSGHWTSWNSAPVAVLTLVALWVILGPVDLWRMSWKNSWKLSRDNLHAQARMTSGLYVMPIESVPTAAEFIKLLRDERRAARRSRRPG